MSLWEKFGLRKIDNQATLGLLGTYNSLAYRVEEIEGHIHVQEKWFGKAALAVGETHVADRMGPSIVAFSLTSGNNAFGDWVQILGSTDTPVKSGSAYFDGHRVIVIDANDINPFLIQVVGGESADITANLASNNYTEFPFIAITNQIDAGAGKIITSRAPTGTKVWARTICIGASGKIIKAFFGIHEYEG